MKHVCIPYFVITILFFSCTSMEEMPRFVSIFTGEMDNVKLVSYTQDKENNIELNFDKNIKDISCNVFKDEDETISVANSVEKIDEQENKRFLVSLENQRAVEIGEAFFVKGEVKDRFGNSLLFKLNFTGANYNPCILKISEVRPLYSKKPKSEFIEMVAIKEGNLSGIKILNVGSKKEPDYTFPPAYVKKGEIIVYHWRCFYEEAKDEINANIVSHTPESSSFARDFWGHYKTLPKRRSNAIVIEENGIVQDALLYADAKNQEDEWPSENILQAAQKAFESGVWMPSAEIKDAIQYHITPSASVGRKIIPTENKSNAKQWYLYKSKYVTLGKRNK
ncbi:MAG: hypothetical protein ACTTJ3_01145 [Treponema sp.]